MKKAILSTGLALTLIATAGAASVTAKPSTHKVFVDGVQANVAAYEINDNNYFKLRDIAAILSGTSAQFEVNWDEATGSITLTDDKTYTPVGGELGAIPAGNQAADDSTAAVYRDGTQVHYTGYEINFNNYYKLRDIAADFDFGVTWDNDKQSVMISTTEGYVPEGEEPTEPETEFVDLKGEPTEEWKAVLKENEENGERVGNNNRVYPEGTYEISLTFDIEVSWGYNDATPAAYAPVTIYIRDTERNLTPVTTLVTDGEGEATCTITVPWATYYELTKSNYYIVGAVDDTEYTGDIFNKSGNLGGRDVQILGKTATEWEMENIDPRPMEIHLSN